MLLVEIHEDQQGFSAGNSISDKSIRRITSQFRNEGKSFEIILIGKDGTVKLRSCDVTLDGLFCLIDTMPMRQSEMRQRISR